MRARQLASTASSSRVEVDERTIAEGADIVLGLLRVQFQETVPTCLLIFGAMRLRFASPTTLSLYFLCIGDNSMFFWGVV